MLPLLWAAALGLNNSQLLLVWMVRASFHLRRRTCSMRLSLHLHLK
jgi:hypothetical protein